MLDYRGVRLARFHCTYVSTCDEPHVNTHRDNNTVQASHSLSQVQGQNRAGKVVLDYRYQAQLLQRWHYERAQEMKVIFKGT